MWRLRLRITATPVHYCFYVDGESTNNVFNAITLGGNLDLEQSSSKASWALQAGVLLPLLVL